MQIIESVNIDYLPMVSVAAKFRVKPALVYRLVKAHKKDPCFLDGARTKRERMARKEASIR